MTKRNYRKKLGGCFGYIFSHYREPLLIYAGQQLNWIVVENQHEVIESKELFDKANANIAGLKVNRRAADMLIEAKNIRRKALKNDRKIVLETAAADSTKWMKKRLQK